MNEHHGVLAKMTCGIVTEHSVTPIHCVMFYDMHSPFEVVFSSAEGTEDGSVAEWHYGRDLLKAAIDGDDKVIHGEGDVVVSKEKQFLFTMLQSENRRCVVAFGLDDMMTFLAHTENLVPFGEEKIEEEDIDEALRDLLGE